VSKDAPEPDKARRGPANAMTGSVKEIHAMDSVMIAKMKELRGKGWENTCDPDHAGRLHHYLAISARMKVNPKTADQTADKYRRAMECFFENHNRSTKKKVFPKGPFSSVDDFHIGNYQKAWGYAWEIGLSQAKTVKRGGRRLQDMDESEQFDWIAHQACTNARGFFHFVWCREREAKNPGAARRMEDAGVEKSLPEDVDPTVVETFSWQEMDTNSRIRNGREWLYCPDKVRADLDASRADSRGSDETPGAQEARAVQAEGGKRRSRQPGGRRVRRRDVAQPPAAGECPGLNSLDFELVGAGPPLAAAAESFQEVDVDDEAMWEDFPEPSCECVDI
jgi:hypothetical protein